MFTSLPLSLQLKTWIRAVSGDRWVLSCPAMLTHCCSSLCNDEFCRPSVVKVELQLCSWQSDHCQSLGFFIRCANTGTCSSLCKGSGWQLQSERGLLCHSRFVSWYSSILVRGNIRLFCKMLNVPVDWNYFRVSNQGFSLCCTTPVQFVCHCYHNCNKISASCAKGPSNTFKDENLVCKLPWFVE